MSLRAMSLSSCFEPDAELRPSSFHWTAGTFASCARCFCLCLRRPQRKNKAAMMARSARIPTTMPAIAPPERDVEWDFDVERSASDESAVEAGVDGAVGVVAESSSS